MNASAHGASPVSGSLLWSPPQGAVVHITGIAGSALSQLAGLLQSRGWTVRGTDPGLTETACARWRERGVATSPLQDGRFLVENTAVLIASAAVPPNHPELAAARANGVPVLTYPMALGALMDARQGVAVAGTHGKTTTTALLVWALRAAGRDPSFVLGGVVAGVGTGALAGTEDWMVAEACEYNRSFWHLYPRIAVVTNVEADHLDVYEDEAAIHSAFGRFLDNVPADGVRIVCADDPGARAVAGNRPCRTYGLSPEADCRAVNPRFADGRWHFDAVCGATTVRGVQLPLPGIHNVRNALAVLAACSAMGVDVAAASAGLASFRGVGRRFERTGTFRGAPIIDDYAHHPTELAALIAAARDAYPDRRVVLVFQPHQVSRTTALRDAFAAALTRADAVVLADVFAARDAQGDPVETARELAQAARARGAAIRHAGDLDACFDAVTRLLEPSDVCLVAGAGDVTRLAHRLGTAAR